MCIFDSPLSSSALEDAVSYFGFSFYLCPFVHGVETVRKSMLRSYLDHLDYLAICV